MVSAGVFPIGLITANIELTEVVVIKKLPITGCPPAVGFIFTATVSGKSTLLPSTKLSLDQFLKTYTASKFSKITVNGYTDGQPGMSEYLLSKARADAVRAYLLSKKSKLAIVTFGLSLAPESKVSTKSIQASRKVEIWVS
jgi:hypothetical protein